MLASLLMSQFNTPLASLPAQISTETATPTKVITETPTAELTDLPTETAVLITETPTASIETATPVVLPTFTETPISSASAVTETTFTLSLDTDPGFVTPGNRLVLNWIIEGTSLEERTLVLRIILPPGFSLQGNNRGTYEDINRTFTIPITALSGQIHLRAGNSDLEVLFTANLLEGAVTLATTTLIIPSHEQFVLDKNGGIIDAMGGKLKIKFPKDALAEKAVVAVGKPSGDAIPAYSLLGQPFEIKAHAQQSGAAIKHFPKELSISVSYADMEVPQGLESDLHLYWYNTELQEWEPLPSRVDKETKTLIAYTDHFTVFDMDVNNWQSSHLPTVDSFQVSSFTGAATYSLPIVVPPGPGGFQPSLSLNYNSQMVDQSTLNTQASWVGMGWSLDMGSMELDSHGTSGSEDDTYILNIGGVSTRVVKGPGGTYHTADENFWQITPDSPSDSWIVKDKQGNTYTFAHTSAFPEQNNNCGGYSSKSFRWSLSKVQNIFGQEILYDYQNQTRSVRIWYSGGNDCYFENENAVSATYPSTVTYSHGRYRLRFDIGDMSTPNRSDYTNWWDDPDPGTAFHAFEKHRLQNLYVEQDSNGDGTFETVIRRYELKYKGNTESDIIFPGYTWSKGGKTSTLKSVQQYGANNTTESPKTTFTYGDNLHLTRATNGYGGTVEFDYEQWYHAADARGSYTIEQKFGTSSYPCGNEDPRGWGSREGVVDCGDGDHDPLHIYGSTGIAIAGNIENAKASDYGVNQSKNLVRPGGVYLIETSIDLVNNTGDMSAEVGLFDGVRDHWQAGTVAPRFFILPADASKVEPLIKEEGGNATTKFATVSSYKFKLLTSIYRVVEKRVKDGNGHTYPFDYSYSWTSGPDSAAVNDTNPNHSTTTCDPINPDDEGTVTCHGYFERYSEFRGHGLVTETGPDGKTTVTRFFQDDIWKGRPSWVTVSDGSLLRSKVIYSYVTESLPIMPPRVASCSVCNTPYIGLSRNFVYNNSVENRVYENDGTAYSATKTTYTYETSYGNLTVQMEEGRNGAPFAPYRTTITTYKPFVSTDKYLVGLPARQLVREGDQTGPIQAETVYLYDGNTGSYNTQPSEGKLTAVRSWVDGPIPTGRYSQVTYGYDPYGNRTKEITYEDYTDGDGPTPTTGIHNNYTCYGGGGTVGGLTCADDSYHTYPLWAKDAKGYITNLTYDYTLGIPLSETDPNGSMTRAEYDSFGRITYIYRPNPITGSAGITPSWTITYEDTYPFTTTLTQKLDAVQSYTIQRVYDGMGRQTKMISGGAIVNTIYQSATVTKQSMPYFTADPIYYTTTTLNPAANTATVTAPDGTSTTTSTDGLRTVMTDARGNSTTTTKDLWGRVISLVPPTGPSVTYTYDQFDRLKTATRGGVATVTSLTYDHAGRKIGMDDPDMGTLGTTTDNNWAWTYQYDALGNLTLQKDALGQRICLYYDALNRLKGKHFRTDDNCPASPTYNVSYGYDSGTNGVGQRTSMTDDSGSTSWTYDKRGRVVKEIKMISGNSYTTEWGYNFADLNIWMKYPDTETVNYVYNGRMLLNSVNGTLNSITTNYVQSTNYDAAGRIDLRTLGNSLTQNYDYYDWNEKATVDGILVGQGGRLKNVTVGTLQNLSYIYDPVGNIKQITNSIANEMNSYSYDALNRLMSWNLNGTTETYIYDPTTGNLDVKAGIDLNYNDKSHKHAVTHMSGIQKYWYDANGNQTKRILGVDTYDLAYDAENHLSQVKKNNIVIATFTFDGDGKRVQSVMGSETTVFVGEHFEIKNPGSGQTTTKYYFAGTSRIATRKYIIPQSMIMEYMLSDHLGSTSLTADANGTKVSEMLYEPWGELRFSWTAGTSTTPAYKLPNYTFTEQYSYMDDPSTIGATEGFELMYYGARWYDPALGRFNQPDTIIPPTQGSQAWDRYAYTNNNPVLHTDPSGHWVETAFDLVSLGMTINDIRNEGFTVMNTISLVTDVASVVLPIVPAGVSHALRAAKYASKATNIVDTAVDAGKVANKLDDLFDAAKELDEIEDLRKIIGDKTVAFWSGGDKAKDAARAWAESNNGITLEMTELGQRVAQLTEGIQWKDQIKYWDKASEILAIAVQKDEARAFLTQRAATNVTSVWSRIEEGTLKLSPMVKYIHMHFVD
jgi:RHS repeat-associated protein